MTNPSSEQPAPGGASSEGADTIRRAWRRNRDAALTEFFAGFRGSPGFSSLAASPTPEGDSGDNRLWLGFATVAAVCGDEHEQAADGYFHLASLTDVGGEPSPAGRLWYERSLDHARRAQNDFAAARAAYCLGRLEASQGLPNSAREHFLAAREHADRA